MKVVWPRSAVRGRERQIDYIAERNPATAAKLEQRIIDATDQLIDHPRLGRAGRVRGTRELVVARTPYIVVYEIRDDTVRIFRVLHSAQCWPPMNWRPRGAYGDSHQANVVTRGRNARYRRAA